MCKFFQNQSELQKRLQYHSPKGYTVRRFSFLERQRVAVVSQIQAPIIFFQKRNALKNSCTKHCMLSNPVAEASGSRTHPCRITANIGFEVRAQHRLSLASSDRLFYQPDRSNCSNTNKTLEDTRFHDHRSHIYILSQNICCWLESEPFPTEEIHHVGTGQIIEYLLAT